MTSEESEYALARHYIEALKKVVLGAIKRARRRARWDEGDDDEYFAEEIARDIFNDWREKKGMLK